MNKLLNEAARTIPPSVVKEDWKKRLLPEAKSGHSIWRNPPARKLRKKVKMLYTRANGVYTDRAYLRFCKLKKNHNNNNIAIPLWIGSEDTFIKD